MEITIFDDFLMELDGIQCTYPNGTIFPAPLSCVLIMDVNVFIFREVSCYYSTIPLFYSYSSKLQTSISFSMNYNDDVLQVGNDYAYFINTEGCIPMIVTPTEKAPTPAPVEGRLF